MYSHTTNKYLLPRYFQHDRISIKRFYDIDNIATNARIFVRNLDYCVLCRLPGIFFCRKNFLQCLLNDIDMTLHVDVK